VRRSDWNLDTIAGISVDGTTSGFISFDIVFSLWSTRFGAREFDQEMSSLIGKVEEAKKFCRKNQK